MEPVPLAEAVVVGQFGIAGAIGGIRQDALDPPVITPLQPSQGQEVVALDDHVLVRTCTAGQIRHRHDVDRLPARSLAQLANIEHQELVEREATDQYKPIVEGKTLAQHEMAQLVVQNHPDVFTGSFRQAMAKAHAEIRAYGMKTFGKGKKERKRAVANFINGADHRRAKPVAGDTRMISEMIIDADPAELIATPAQDEPEVLPPVKKTSRKRRQAKPEDGLVIEGQAQMVEPEKNAPPPSAKVAVDEDDIDLDAAARQLGMTDDSRKQED